MKKSNGHVKFFRNGDFELFEQSGEVFIAPTTNAFDIDGYRHGRWECSVAHYEQFKELYK